MKIKEKIVEIDNSNYLDWNSLYTKILDISKINTNQVIKINLVKTTVDKLYFDLVYIDKPHYKSFLSAPYIGLKCTKSKENPNTTALIIPTGIGAGFGGFAGDGNPLARLFSLKSKFLLTHPNVINGSVLSHPPENLINLEGYFLNQFLLGQIKIQNNYRNKIGVIFDKQIPLKKIEYEVNVLNACKSFYGADILGFVITEHPLNVRVKINSYGFSTGVLENLNCLISNALKLKKLGATSLAVVTSIPDPDLNPNYVGGFGIDPIGGVESIISHVVSAYTGLVCANAPVLRSKEKVNYSLISPVSASEYISETFLPSVINGLRYAPKIHLLSSKIPELKNYYCISDIVIPSNAFGSPGVIFQNNVSNRVTLIRENKTCLNVSLNHITNKFKVKKKYLEYFKKDDLICSKSSADILKRPICSVKNIV